MLQDFTGTKGLPPQSIIPRQPLRMVELHSKPPKTSGQLCPEGLNRGWHSQCDPQVKLNTASCHGAGVSQLTGHSRDPGAGVVPEHGMERHGMAWHAMVWHSLVWHDTVCAVWCGMASMAVTEIPPRDTSTSEPLQSHPDQASSSREGGSFIYLQFPSIPHPTSWSVPAQHPRQEQVQLQWGTAPTSPVQTTLKPAGPLHHPGTPAALLGTGCPPGTGPAVLMAALASTVGYPYIWHQLLPLGSIGEGERKGKLSSGRFNKFSVTSWGKAVEHTSGNAGLIFPLVLGIMFSLILIFPDVSLLIPCSSKPLWLQILMKP